MQSRESKPALQTSEDTIEVESATSDHANLQILHVREAEARRDPPSFDRLRDRARPTSQTSRSNGGSVSLAHAPILEPFVEADGAAEFLHYSTRSIKQMARDGRIPAHPFGNGPRKRWFFLISELAEYLRAQVNSAHGEAGRDKTQRRVV